MLRRSHVASFAFTSLALSLFAGTTGCGSDVSGGSGGQTSTGSTSSSGTGASGGSGGEGNVGGSGGAGGLGGAGGMGGMGGMGGTMCVPQGPEVCGDNLDNDCNGTVDEGCCAVGTTQPCYTGAPGTENVGLCVAGIQTCDANGQFGACVGEVVPTPEMCDGVDNDCNGTADTDAGCVCLPGTAKTCYTGPANTMGVGQCVAGAQSCAADGKSYDPACVGQVLPGAEACDGIDNDCNGTVDDGPGCFCVPNSMTTCYTGPAGTLGKGVCAGGMQTCNAMGTGYGVCLGEVLPSLENCASAVDEDCSGAAEACTGAHMVSKKFGDAVAQLGTDVAVDATGNVYVIGTFTGTVDFGGAVGALTSTGANDVIVAKFDSTGNALWAKKYGNNLDQFGNAIAVDSAGNVAITGKFQGTIAFGPGPLTSAGGDDMFIAKLDTNGNQLWSRQIGNTATQEGMDVAFDSAGDIYVTGQYSGDVLVGAFMMPGVDGLETFLVKYNGAGGNPLFAKSFTGVGTQFGYELAVSPDKQVTLVGAFQNTVNYGGGNLISAGGYDVVIARYDSFGTHIWSKRMGDAADQRALAVGVDKDGNVLATGECSGPVDFGCGALVCAADVDGWVAKLDKMGVCGWSKQFGNTSAQRGNGITADVFGNVVLTGEFFGQVNFGSGPLASTGQRDVFVAKLDPAGTALWAKRYGSTMTQQVGEAVATDPMANIWVTGEFESTIDFGGGLLTSAGNTDMFLAKLAP